MSETKLYHQWIFSLQIFNSLTTTALGIIHLCIYMHTHTHYAMLTDGYLDSYIKESVGPNFVVNIYY